MANPHPVGRSDIYKTYRKGTCGACKRVKQPLDKVHVPDLCVQCAHAIRRIDYQSVHGIRQDMEATGVPLGGVRGDSFYTSLVSAGRKKVRGAD